MEEDVSLKTFLESKKKSTIVLVILSSLIFYVICLIVAGVATPNLTKTKSNIYTQCTNSSIAQCNFFYRPQHFDVLVTSMDTKNHFMYFEIVPYLISNQANASITLYAYGTTDNTTDLIKLSNDSYNLMNEVAEEMIYIPYLTHSTYNFSVIIDVDFSLVTAIKVSITYMEINYFNFLIAVKYFFLACTIISLIIFMFNSRQIKISSWSFETSSALIMNISLFIFNEPLIGAYTEFFGVAYSSISIFCNTQFFNALVLFWIFMLQKKLMNKSQYVLITFEFFFVIALFCFYFTTYLYVEMNLLYNKRYDWHKDFDYKFKTLYQVLIAVLVLIAAWVVLLMILSVKKWIGLDSRYKIYWVFSYAMAIVTFVFIGLGYFQLMQTGQILLSVIALYNIYLYVLLWLSTPDRIVFRDSVEYHNKFESEMSKNRA